MSEEVESTDEDVSALRKAAAGGAAAKAELELVKRELAFTKAGIPTDTRAGQAMVKSYEGDLNAEALLAEAKEWGIEVGGAQVPATEEVEEQVTPVQELADLQAARDLASGAPAPATQPVKDAYGQTFDAFLKDRDDGLSQLDATDRAFGRMIQHAAAGTPGARFDQEAWEAQQDLYGHGAKFAK